MRSVAMDSLDFTGIFSLGGRLSTDAVLCDGGVTVTRVSGVLKDVDLFKTSAFVLLFLLLLIPTLSPQQQQSTQTTATNRIRAQLSP